MRVDYTQVPLSAAAEAALLKRLFAEGWVPAGDGVLQIEPFWDGEGMYRSICILVEEAATLDGPWRPVGSVYILDSEDIVQAVLEEEHLGKMPTQQSGSRALFCAVKGLQGIGGSPAEALNDAIIQAMTASAGLPVRAEDEEDEEEKEGAGECPQVPLPFWEMPPQWDFIVEARRWYNELRGPPLDPAEPLPWTQWVSRTGDQPAGGRPMSSGLDWSPEYPGLPPSGAPGGTDEPER